MKNDLPQTSSDTGSKSEPKARRPSLLHGITLQPTFERAQRLGWRPQGMMDEFPMGHGLSIKELWLFMGYYGLMEEFGAIFCSILGIRQDWDVTRLDIWPWIRVMMCYSRGNPWRIRNAWNGLDASTSYVGFNGQRPTFLLASDTHRKPWVHQYLIRKVDHTTGNQSSWSREPEWSESFDQNC